MLEFMQMPRPENTKDTNQVVTAELAIAGTTTRFSNGNVFMCDGLAVQ